MPITLTQAETLTAGDVTVSSAIGVNYGPVTVSGSGTNYTITLAHPINMADRVTITIGNASIAPFNRRLDVLPGDFNDDGVVNSQDLVGIRNEWLGIGGAKPTIFGDINGDGEVNVADYNAVRRSSARACRRSRASWSPASRGRCGSEVVRIGASGVSPIVGQGTSARPARFGPRVEIRLARQAQIASRGQG